MSGVQQEAIVVAVEDPVLHPEAMHVAAATGRPVVETCVPAEVVRASRSASAVLVDAVTAAVFTHERRDRVFFLGLDPGPVDWRRAMECHAEHAFLLPAQAPELLAMLGRHNRARGTARTIGVMGVCGGAGTSVLAASIALTGAPALLIDAVPYGGADLLLGIENTPGARWQDLNLGDGFVGASDLWQALPHTKSEVAVLTSARTTMADGFSLDPARVSSAVECAQTGDNLVVVDTCDAAVLGLCDLVALVIPAEVRAVAAATTLAAQLKAQRIHPIGVLRHRGWSGMDADEVERVVQLPIVGEVAHVPRLAKTVETQGLHSIPRPLTKVALDVMDELNV